MANSNPLPPPEESQFKPGQSGNPEGRPKGTKNLSTILREMLELEIEVDGVKITQKDAIIKKLIKKSTDGELNAIQEIFDRTEGRAKQEMKIEGLAKGILNIDPLADDTANNGPTEDRPA